MITEDYVSFETAKLLKEKGFNGLCTAYYDCFTTDNFHCGNEPTDFNSIDTKIRDIVAAPTLQMAMKWLRKEHNIHAEVRIFNHLSSSLIVVPRYYWIILNVKEVKWMDESTAHESKSYETFEEACEVAIKYCLENLI